MTIPKPVRQNEVYMSFWTKEREGGNSQVDEKKQTFDKFLQDSSETMEHKGEPSKQIFA